MIEGKEIAALDQTDSGDLEKLKELFDYKHSIVVVDADFYIKVQAIQLLQSFDNEVTCVGDGIYDICGLRCANVGVAMGSGCIEAKTIADITVHGDKLTLISQTIDEGLYLITNVTKVLLFTFSSVVGDIAITLTHFYLATPGVMTTQMCLHINSVIKLLGVLCIALGRSEQNIDYLDGWIYKATWLTITGIVQAFSSYFCFLVVSQDYGVNPLSLYGIFDRRGYEPLMEDIYNNDTVGYGNTNIWLTTTEYAIIANTSVVAANLTVIQQTTTQNSTMSTVETANLTESESNSFNQNSTTDTNEAVYENWNMT